MSLIGKQAPDFTASAVLGDNTIVDDFTLSSLRGKYVLLFFYPLDFTFVCPTEIIAYNRAYKKFQERGVEIVGVSVDSQYSHFAWKNTPVKEGGIGNIDYPLVSDLTKQISRDYDVLFEEAGVAFRGTFLINKEGIIKHATINDLGLGRNIDEALRMVDALRYHEEHGEVCPANWDEGQEAIKPTTEGIAEYLAKNLAE